MSGTSPQGDTGSHMKVRAFTLWVYTSESKTTVKGALGGKPEAGTGTVGLDKDRAQLRCWQWDVQVCSGAGRAEGCSPTALCWWLSPTKPEP